ncbi:hypothetical protein LQW54_010393 [Pestalotiopsis sp. IQ-011]
MVAGVTSTFFSPEPSCAAASNLWLSAAPCSISTEGASEEDATCTYAFLGERPKSSSLADACFATYESNVASTECPVTYTYAGRHSSWEGAYYAVSRYCCPEAYNYAWETDHFLSSSGDTFAWVSLSDQPRCRVARVQALQSQIVTVKAAAAAGDGAEPTVTTTAWENNAPLFAEAETVRAYVYQWDGGDAVSTCYGAKCPLSYEPTPTFPSTITPTPSARSHPAPGCLDPGNFWIVTTSCFVESPTLPWWETPARLACSVTHVATTTGSDSGEPVYYDGCPEGYSALATQSAPGVLSHGTAYEINILPMPGCYATSVEVQSGKQVPMQTWSNTMGWDKRDDGGAGQLPTTVSWDYEHGTVYAMAEGHGHTVFQGTHTCYESCSTWLSYYYPDGTGGPWPITTTTITTSESSSLTSTSSGGAQSTVTPCGAATQTGTGPAETGIGTAETGTGTAETGAGTLLKSNTATVVIFWLGLLLAV